MEKSDEIRPRKVVTATPWSGDDPFWKLIGAGTSGLEDVSSEHEAMSRRERSKGGASPRRAFAVMDHLGLRNAFAFDPHFRQYGFQVIGFASS